MNAAPPALGMEGNVFLIDPDLNRVSDRGCLLPAKGSPRGLRVFDETVSSMKVSWEPAPGAVLQYRLAYRASAGGPRKEVSVKGSNTAVVLKKLQPGTDYDVSVSARYRSGLGEALEGRGATLAGKSMWARILNAPAPAPYFLFHPS